MLKKTAAKIGCGCFDQPDLQVFKRLQIFLFHFATAILKYMGCLIYTWKHIDMTFPTLYYMPPNSITL